MKVNKKGAIFVLLIIFISIITYANAFKNEFVFDDTVFVVNNYDIRSIDTMPKFFSEPSHGNLYRPLRSVWYTIVFQFSGLNTFGYHLNSLALHMLVCILLYLITVKILKKRWIAFFAAALFAAHPIHTDRVTNMTAGFDILGILLMLVAFYLYIVYSSENKKNYLYVSFLVFLIAIFSSEEAVYIFPLILLYEISFGKGMELLKKEKIIDNIRTYVPYFIIFIAYFTIRTAVVGKVGRVDIYQTGGMYASISTTFTIFVKYIFKLFVPINLQVEYHPTLYNSIFGLNVLLSIAVLIAIIAIGLYFYNKSRLIFFGIFWFFGTMLIFTNIFPVPTLMAERYLYLSSFGFCLIIGYLLYMLMKSYGEDKSKKSTFAYAALIILAVVIISYAAIAIQRNTEWKDSITLWSKTLEQEPMASRAYDNLGFTYQEMGQNEKAIPLFLKAIEINPSNPNAYQNLGASYAALKDYSKAKQSFLTALSIYPKMYKSIDNLGLIYDIQGNYSNAINFFNLAIEADPTLHKAHMDLAKTLTKIGRYDDAEKEFLKAIEIRPELADPHYNIGVFYEFQNKTQEAASEFKIAYNIDPQNKIYQKKYNKYFG